MTVNCTLDRAGCATDIHSRETFFARDVCRLYGTSSTLSSVTVFGHKIIYGCYNYVAGGNNVMLHLNKSFLESA